MKTRILIAVCGLIWALTVPPRVWAGGLSCSLGEVVVENLQIGTSYDLTKLANLQFRVTNTDSQSNKLRMEILVPDTSELRLNAEPIPDAAWVHLSASEFTVPAQGQADAKILLTIPDDKRLLGKRFEFMVWSHTLPSTEGGMFLACGLKSRVIFSTDNERHVSVESVDTPSSSGVLLEPDEIHWHSGEASPVITVLNNGDAPQTMHLKAESVHDSYATMTAGYEDCEPAATVTFSNDTFDLPPHGSRQVTMGITAALAKAHPCMMIIAAQSGSDAVQRRVYARLLMNAQ